LRLAGTLAPPVRDSLCGAWGAVVFFRLCGGNKREALYL